MIPAIDAVPLGVGAPLLVGDDPGVPRADSALLERALASVLADAPGPEAMHIEVVDDGSGPADGAEALVAKVGAGRVVVDPAPQRRRARRTSPRAYNGRAANGCTFFTPTTRCCPVSTSTVPRSMCTPTR